MTKDQIHEAIDRLSPGQLNQVRTVLEQLSHEDPRERWRSIAGLKVSEVWPPDYGDFKAVQFTGDAVADQIVRERR